MSLPDPLHSLSSLVLFQPCLKSIDQRTGRTTAPETAIPAKVVRISFAVGMVLYDLALQHPDWEEGWSYDDRFIESLPIRDVAQMMVCPFEN